MKVLHQHGAALDAKDEEAISPLYGAVQNGEFFDVVEYLITNGAQLDKPTKNG